MTLSSYVSSSEEMAKFTQKVRAQLKKRALFSICAQLRTEKIKFSQALFARRLNPIRTITSF